MIRCGLIYLFGTIMLISGETMSAPPSTALLNEGYSAYDNDNYDLAARRLVPFERTGPARAQFLLAMMYLNGLSVPMDLEKGKYLLTKAAGSGDMDAAFVLGSEQLYEGKFFPVNPPEAIRYLKIAADGGQGQAMHELGWVYYDSGITEQDLPLSFHYFQKSALIYAESPYALAHLFSEGHGTPRDAFEAYCWGLVGKKVGDSRVDRILLKEKPLLKGGEEVKAARIAEERFATLLANIKQIRSHPGHGK